MNQNKELCPCGTGKTYHECCQPCHLQNSRAGTAEDLMRSRYSAYVFGNEPYLLATWYVNTRPETLELAGDRATKWIDLKILRTERGQVNDNEGIVEFVARYKINGKAYKLHEVSRFVKESGQWFYVDRAE